MIRHMIRHVIINFVTVSIVSNRGRNNIDDVIRSREVTHHPTPWNVFRSLLGTWDPSRSYSESFG